MATAAVNGFSFTFRDPEPPPTAAELLADIRSRGGRVHRMMKPPGVFVLTTDSALAAWLQDKGARLKAGPYPLARGDDRREWDLTLNSVKTDGSLWEAAQ